MRSDLSPNQNFGSHPSLVRAKVKTHEQDPDTRQWSITAELRGGRIVTDVKPTFANSGVYSGDRPELPAVGTWGLIGYAESDVGLDAYFICCFDGHTHGLDRDSPFEAVNLHRSGLGRATSPDGTMTTRFPGGDELTVGSGAGYEFMARDIEGKLYKPNLPQRALRVLLDARKGGLQLGAKLIGGVEVIVDAARRLAMIRVAEKDSLTIKPGLIRAETGSMVVGHSEDNAASVARWPETQATLDALTKELQQVKHAVVMERAKNLRQDIQIKMILAHPVITPIAPPVLAVPTIPLPFITPQGKDGAMAPTIGGVKVVDAGSKTLHAE